MNSIPTAQPRTAAQSKVLLVAGLGSFMTTLGTGLVNVANPEIQVHFRSTLGESAWVVTSYLLAVSVLLLIFGRLGDVFGYRRLFTMGLVGFACASVLCCVVGPFSLLIAARLLQGGFAAILMAMGPALITTSFPPQQRGRALGVLGTATYLGLSAGPVLGGALLGLFGWRSVFLVNVPIAAGCLLAVRAFSPESGTGPARRPIDPLSALLWAGFLTPALIALSTGEKAGWTSARIVALSLVALLCLSVFSWRQTRIDNPLMSWSLFANVVFRNSTIAAYLLYLVSFLMMFILPFYLRNGWHLQMASVGLVITVQPIVMTVLAPFSGVMSDKFGARVPATVGMVLIAAGLLLIGLAAVQHSLWFMLVSLAVFGGGAGLFTTANNSAIMGNAPREHQGAASGILAVSRNVGMATGVALGGVLFAFFGKHDGGFSAEALFKTMVVGAALSLVGSVFSWSRGAEPAVVSATPTRS